MCDKGCMTFFLLLVACSSSQNCDLTQSIDGSPQVLQTRNRKIVSARPQQKSVIFCEVNNTTGDFWDVAESDIKRSVEILKADKSPAG
ncbi:MAG: hypothetical protein LBQ43_02025, partial [Holosporales bacterium]|nr:hypothetical protein [Holosporales bacterium]